jgi:hypothetical protein
LIALLALLAFAGTSRPAYAQKTVHVKEYKKKDGTVVKAHDRKAPTSKGGASTTSSTSVTSGGSSPSAAVLTNNGTAATATSSPIELKLMGSVPPPLDGFVTAILASGQSIRLRAQDIDYPKTATAPSYLVIRPESFELLHDRDGRSFFSLKFSDGYRASAWQEDVNLALTNTPAQEVVKPAGLAYATYSRFIEGMTLDQANQLFGFEPVEISRAEISGAKTVLYQWKQGDAVIVAMFKDGHLLSKMAFALR